MHLDTKNSFDRSAAVKRSISIYNAKIPSGAIALRARKELLFRPEFSAPYKNGLV